MSLRDANLLKIEVTHGIDLEVPFVNTLISQAMLLVDPDHASYAEAMRAESLKKTSRAMISRAVAGVRGATLIINLPGSPKAVKENLAVVLPVLSHTIDKIKGGTEECGKG